MFTVTQNLKEFKILPNSFEKALASNDKIVREAYKRLRKEDFSDWWTMGELKEEWLASQANNYPDSKELLEAFPEAKEYINFRIKTLQKAVKSAKNRLEVNLRAILKEKDELLAFVKEEINRLWLAEPTDKMIAEEGRLKFLLSDKKEIADNRITKKDIQRAKIFPMPRLLGLPEKEKQHALCPKHAEKNGSFYITKNKDNTWFGYCFSCGYSVDNINLLMDRGYSFPEAVKKLV